MSERKAYAEGYLKGYDEGVSEAWEELLGLTTKGYTSREIQILAKARRPAFRERLEQKRAAMMKEAEFSEPIEEAPARVAAEPQAILPQAELDIPPGSLCIIKDTRLEAPIAYIKRRLGEGAKAMCILRTHPDSVRSRYGLECSMVWLTKTESCPIDGEQPARFDFVSPTELPRLNSLIKSFLAENRGGSIMLEGLEYLVTQNDFKSVLKFLQGVKDQVILARGVLLLPFDPTVLDQKDLKSLEREMEH